MSRLTESTRAILLLYNWDKSKPGYMLILQHVSLQGGRLFSAHSTRTVDGSELKKNDIC